MKKPVSISIALLLLLSLGLSAFADLTPVSVENGQVIVATDYEQVCPFTVETQSDFTYYLYLQYLRAPAETTEDRALKRNASGEQGDFSFIVAPNSTVSLDVPVGVYRLYYCVGDEWYGTSDKFGKGTRYYSSDDLLEFNADSEHYNGHILQLWAQVNGNFEDHPINESGFPGTEASPENDAARTYTVYLDRKGGRGGTASVEATHGEPMPAAEAPVRKGYSFMGYYTFSNGKGTQYYDGNMASVRNWDKFGGGSLFAYWVKEKAAVGGSDPIDKRIPSPTPPAPAPAVREYTAKQNPADQSPVYADILSIEPAFALLYDQNGIKSLRVKEIVCECETTEHESIYVYISVEDYRDHFDPSASFSTGDGSSFSAISFSPSARIEGVARPADEVHAGLSELTGGMIFCYGG